MRLHPNYTGGNDEPTVTAKDAGAFDEYTAQEKTSRADRVEADVQKERLRIEAERESSTISGNQEKQKNVTAVDTAKIDAKHKHDSQFATAAKKKQIKNWKAKGELGAMIGLGAFAAASVLDTNQTLSEEKNTARMVKEQERNLQRKQTQKRREEQRDAYGYVDFGGMVTELWNERTGHHKMGNAKFQ